MTAYPEGLVASPFACTYDHHGKLAVLLCVNFVLHGIHVHLWRSFGDVDMHRAHQMLQIRTAVRMVMSCQNCKSLGFNTCVHSQGSRPGKDKVMQLCKLEPRSASQRCQHWAPLAVTRTVASPLHCQKRHQAEVRIVTSVG